MSLFERLPAPRSADDRVANICGALPFIRHFFSKEDLLDADVSAGSVVGRVAEQETVMAGRAAFAETRLLRKHSRDFFRDAIGVAGVTGEEPGCESLRERFRFLLGKIKRKPALHALKLG